MRVSTFIETGIVGGTVTTCVLLVCLSVWLYERERRDRSLLPWGSRRRVERARADAEVASFRKQAEEYDLQHLALQPMRARVEKAIRDDEYVTAKELLAGPQATLEGEQLRQGFWK